MCCSQVCGVSAKALVLLFSGHLLRTGGMTPGTLVAFIMYLENIWHGFIVSFTCSLRRKVASALKRTTICALVVQCDLELFVGHFQFLIDWQANRVSRLMVSLERFFEYLEREPEQKQCGTLQPDDLRGKIEFRDVSFHYPTRPESAVLQVSFQSQHNVQRRRK